jgi:hypothetical protein
MLGGGIPGTNNPHGMTVDDLSPGSVGSLDEHQTVEHTNGISAISSPNLLAGAVNTAAVPDELVLTNFTGTDSVYIRGKRVNTLVGSNIITFNTATADPTVYGIYLGYDGVVFKQAIAAYPSRATSNNWNYVHILNLVNIPAGSYTLRRSTDGFVYFGQGSTFASGHRIPSSDDTVARLYLNNNLDAYVDVCIKASSVPGTNQDDTIVVSALPDPDETVMLCAVPWSGTAGGPGSDSVGYGFTITNQVFDTRVFGTSSQALDRTDSAAVPSKFFTDVANNGFAFVTTAVDGAAGTTMGITHADAIGSQHIITPSGSGAPYNFTYSGGIVYLGGKRLVVAPISFTLGASLTRCIYIDKAGSAIVSASTLPALAAVGGAGSILPVCTITTPAAGPISGSAVTNNYVYTNIIDLRRDVPYGVQGLDSLGNITKTTTSIAPMVGLASSAAGGSSIGISTSGNFAAGVAIAATGDNANCYTAYVSGANAIAQYAEVDNASAIGHRVSALAAGATPAFYEAFGADETAVKVFGHVSKSTTQTRIALMPPYAFSIQRTSVAAGTVADYSALVWDPTPTRWVLINNDSVSTRTFVGKIDGTPVGSTITRVATWVTGPTSGPTFTARLYRVKFKSVTPGGYYERQLIATATCNTSNGVSDANACIMTGLSLILLENEYAELAVDVPAGAGPFPTSYGILGAETTYTYTNILPGVS